MTQANQTGLVEYRGKSRKKKASGDRVVGGVDGKDPLDYRLAFEPKNDLGNARRLLARHGQDLLYVQEVGWHVWDGRRWSREVGEVEVERRAHETVGAIRDEARALAEADGDKAVPRDMIEDHHKWAVQSGNLQRLRAMVVAAQTYCTRKPGEMDANRLALCLANGVLDLSGLCEAVRAHRRGDLITKLIDIPYDPDAACPRFRTFLEEIMPDPAVRDFLQRSFGYTLTGLTGEQCLWFFHGTGANGKSTLINVVARILGVYCMSLPFTSLVQDDRKRGSEASPDLARLPGSRMVRASEPEKGAKLSEGTVKFITGGEEITTRHLNHEFFDFVPEFKLFLSGNHKPVIRGQDEGIWRRVNLVPFAVSIPKERRKQPEVLEAELWEERAGILAWMVEGLLSWRRMGLKPPPAVVAATADYREESDPLGVYLSQWCRREDRASIQASDLFEAYCLWCRQNAADPVSTTLFGRMMSERGFEKQKVGVVRYLGLELTDEASLAVDSARRRHRKPAGDED